MKEIALVYLAAGISSRFQGKIKQLEKVGKNNETLIECSLKQALPAGFSKIIFIVGNKTEKPIKQYFGNNYNGIPVEYALQEYDEKLRDKPWGTVDALCAALDLIDCPFIVCNSDDLYGEKSFKILFDHLQNSDETASLGYKIIDVLPEKGSTNRGIFQIKNNYAQEIKEVLNIIKENLNESGLKPSDLCSMNIFALHPEIIRQLKQKLEIFKTENIGDREIECLLPNELSSLIKQGKIKMKIYPTTEKWLGITNPGDEEIVKQTLNKTFINSILFLLS